MCFWGAVKQAPAPPFPMSICRVSSSGWPGPCGPRGAKQSFWRATVGGALTLALAGITGATGAQAGLDSSSVAPKLQLRHLFPLPYGGIPALSSFASAVSIDSLLPTHRHLLEDPAEQARQIALADQLAREHGLVTAPPPRSICRRSL